MIAPTWVFLLHAPELKRIIKRIIWILNNSMHYLKSFQVLSVVWVPPLGKHGDLDIGPLQFQTMGQNWPTHPDALFWPTTMFSQRPCFLQAAPHQWPRQQGTKAGRPVLLWQTGHDGSSALPNSRRTALCTRGPILTLCSQARLSPPSGGPSWLLSRNLPQSFVSSSPNKLTCVYLPQVGCSENLGSQVDTPNTSLGDKTEGRKTSH